MRKTVKVSVTAKPVSNRSIQIRTSVSNGGTTKTKTQTIRTK